MRKEKETIHFVITRLEATYTSSHKTNNETTYYINFFSLIVLKYSTTFCQLPKLSTYFHSQCNKWPNYKIMKNVLHSRGKNRELQVAQLVVLSHFIETTQHIFLVVPDFKSLLKIPEKDIKILIKNIFLDTFFYNCRQGIPQYYLH